MSSIIACRLPPDDSPADAPLSPGPSPLEPPLSVTRLPGLSGTGTSRGVLSREVRPIDWASRRAGSTVSTTTCRPCSAARRPRAAAVVVLPTPPDPQQTMTLVRRSSIRRSMSSGGGAAFWPVMLCLPLASGALLGAAPPAHSCRPLLAEGGRQAVQAAQADAVGDHGEL